MARIVSEIYIYPVKSLGGIPLKESRILAKGLEHDRRWMLIDENNRFMTQREHTQLALFRCEQEADGISVRHGSDSIKLPMENQGSDIQAVIWDDSVLVREVDPSLSEWFSSRLDISVKLVSFPESNPRPIDPAYAKAGEQVSLADAYPLLLIGQTSLDDLNTRLESPLPMNRFRPNIVFTGGEAYEEDEIRPLQIGGNAFQAVKCCARCVLTTIDQETGVKGKEPLRTLASYRTRNSKVYFGQNIIPTIHTSIRVGDELIWK